MITCITRKSKFIDSPVFGRGESSQNLIVFAQGENSIPSKEKISAQLKKLFSYSSKLQSTVVTMLTVQLPFFQMITTLTVDICCHCKPEHTEIDSDIRHATQAALTNHIMTFWVVKLLSRFVSMSSAVKCYQNKLYITTGRLLDSLYV